MRQTFFVVVLCLFISFGCASPQKKDQGSANVDLSKPAKCDSGHDIKAWHSHCGFNHPRKGLGETKQHYVIKCYKCSFKPKQQGLEMLGKDCQSSECSGDGKYVKYMNSVKPVSKKDAVPTMVQCSDSGCGFCPKVGKAGETCAKCGSHKYRAKPAGVLICDANGCGFKPNPKVAQKDGLCAKCGSGKYHLVRAASVKTEKRCEKCDFRPFQKAASIGGTCASCGEGTYAEKPLSKSPEGQSAGKKNGSGTKKKPTPAPKTSVTLACSVCKKSLLGKSGDPCTHAGCAGIAVKAAESAPKPTPKKTTPAPKPKTSPKPAPKKKPSTTVVGEFKSLEDAAQHAKRNKGHWVVYAKRGLVLTFTEKYAGHYDNGRIHFRNVASPHDSGGFFPGHIKRRWSARNAGTAYNYVKVLRNGLGNSWELQIPKFSSIPNLPKKDFGIAFVPGGFSGAYFVMSVKMLKHVAETLREKDRIYFSGPSWMDDERVTINLSQLMSDKTFVAVWERTK